MSSEVVAVCNVAPYFSFLLYFVSLFYHRHILDVSLQDSKMLISRETSCKIPKNTVTLLVQWLQCSSTVEPYHILTFILQICVKSQQRWQEEPHYIGTLTTINEWKRLERNLSHPRGKSRARTEAVFPCFTSAFRILQSDVIGDYLPQSSH